MKLKPCIIGLLGKAGSGKSTVANYLAEKYGAKETSFAFPLKMMAAEMFGFSDDQLFGTQAQKEAIDPRYNVSPRYVMQMLGSAGRNWLGSEVWIRACLDKIKHSLDSVDVISDVRHLNEAEALISRGHTVIKLVCSDAPPASNSNHPSEAEVDLVPAAHISYTIYNYRAGGLNSLYKIVDAALEELELLVP